ncbi:pimeloyl-ACP methyl ester carboxylesterase [Nakamurella sp. UYEF19]|uniref:alpha/beta hydrolase n=1 Tax=Nakamurella sp. UYEF19 TaxID=1756392 RepID=UPI003397CE6E
MLSSRRSRSRSRHTVKLVGLVGTLVLVAACTTGVAGSALPAGTVTAATGTSTGDPTGQITQPSVLPSQSSSGSSATAAPGTTSSGTGAPSAVPAGLEKFYSQKLSWGSCGDYATNASDLRIYASAALQCARMTVPMAYADPTGPTVQVALLRKVATDSSARIGSLLMNPGGPGVSGMSFVSQVAAYGIAKQLNQRFDLVGFDPRGIGSSIPLIQCQTDAQLDATRADPIRSETAAQVVQANDQSKTYINECLSATAAGGVDAKKFLANVGSRDVARDLDVTRAALGDNKLTYAGFSYGTRIGSVYAEEFPGNVRAMILDGAVDPDEDPATDSLNQVKGFQQAFIAYATSCAQQSTCPLGTDPQKATAVFQSLTRPLLDKPLPLADGRVLSYSDATLAVGNVLYDNANWPDLTTAVTALVNGNGAGLMAQADDYYGRTTAGKYTRKPDAFNAIRCVDGPRMTDPGDVTKLNAEEAAAAPFEDSGDPPANIPDVCAYWPVPPTLEPHILKVPGLPKVVVISTTGDPATPYAAGVHLAKQLGANLITYQGTRHTAYLTAGSKCVDAAGNAYLIDLTLPGTDAKCS